ncbi:hypothetical protein EON83_24920 [bacterium]|nr:MAG: hypothetical protein EON83_24920 [bacterium]
MTISRYKVALLLVLGGCVSLSPSARAQNNLAIPTTKAPQVPEVTNADLATLELTGPGAISLRATMAGLRANPNADAAIKAWVARGNVVFLHTDAAQSFGFVTTPMRQMVHDEGGQEFIRTCAALPFGAHPLLRGEAMAGQNLPSLDERNIDVTRLPGVQVVFGSLRNDDVLVDASDIATPLLEVQDMTSNDEGGADTQYAAAITSLGAGWAIFSPDQIDTVRGDGELFARTLLDFVPGETGQHWVGVPTRTLKGGDPAIIAAALAARLSASDASNGGAALPAFGVVTTPALAPPVSESTLPLDRAEANAFLAALKAGGVRATARIALMQARLALQTDDYLTFTAALNVADADPALSSEIDFWNACMNVEQGCDVGKPAPEIAALFGGAARAFAQSAALSPAVATNQKAYASASPVSAVLARNWSQRLARFAEIYSLLPAMAQRPLLAHFTTTIRSTQYKIGEFTDKSVVGQPISFLASHLIVDRPLGWNAPHVEVILTDTPQQFVALRRALGARNGVAAPNGDQIKNYILLTPAGRNEATLRRLWCRVLLWAWTDDKVPVPGWLLTGLQEGAIGDIHHNSKVILLQAGIPLFSAMRTDIPTPMGAAYSTVLVQWLYANFGYGTMSNVVAQMAAGETFEDALGNATGETTEELEDDWVAFLRA